ncbi:FixH family protein [Sphaerisporangium corydalis]|uniref:FixH family protein n=1 Tax=Sphaerisporangium corydalis TaxID=1441875 RepID=A0ABV9EME3_9ACTN|nr:FixH family protein [Sphaerisporangium corydalis]
MKAVLWAAGTILLAGAALLLWPIGPGPMVTTLRTARHQVTMTVDDPKRGANTFGLEIVDRTGEPATMTPVTIELVMPAMGHALPPVTAIGTGPGRYRVPDTDIPMAGQWEMTVSLAGTEKALFSLLLT